MTMSPPQSRRQELRRKGFMSSALYADWVDTDFSRPTSGRALICPDRFHDCPVGRGREKTLRRFSLGGLCLIQGLSGDDRREPKLQAPGSESEISGLKTGKDLTSHRGRRLLCFPPSRTDTFGVVQLEACMLPRPRLAFPVPARWM